MQGLVKKAFGYVRISKLRSGKDGLSLPCQSTSLIPYRLTEVTFIFIGIRRPRGIPAVVSRSESLAYSPNQFQRRYSNQYSLRWKDQQAEDVSHHAHSFTSHTVQWSLPLPRSHANRQIRVNRACSKAPCCRAEIFRKRSPRDEEAVTARQNQDEERLFSRFFSSISCVSPGRNKVK